MKKLLIIASLLSASTYAQTEVDCGTGRDYGNVHNLSYGLNNKIFFDDGILHHNTTLNHCEVITTKE